MSEAAGPSLLSSTCRGIFGGEGLFLEERLGLETDGLGNDGAGATTRGFGGDGGVVGRKRF